MGRSSCTTHVKKRGPRREEKSSVSVDDLLGIDITPTSPAIEVEVDVVPEVDEGGHRQAGHYVGIPAGPGW